MNATLDEARARIDEIDHTLLSLLAERARITRDLAAWKVASSLPLRDPAREAAMLEDRRAMAISLGLDPWLAEAVTRAVLASNRGITDDDVAAFAAR
ncbi:MAG: chorismate mutase [Polyangiales bacterium]